MNEDHSTEGKPANKLWTRDFTIITLGSVVSMVGGTMTGFAISIMVLDYTGSTFLYALFNICFQIPMLVCPLLAGPVLDRMSRKKVIYSLDFLSSFVFLVFYLVMRSGWFSYPFLLAGTLPIGASDTVTSFFLTPYLETFHHQHPGIRLKIVSGRSAKVLSLLKSGVVDIAFASSPADKTNLLDFPCFETHSVFVAGSNYPCDFDHVYTLQEIAAFPLILLERKASSRVFLEQYFLKRGVTLTPEIELSSRSLLVSLAKIGLGVAGVTREFVQDALDSGEIRQLRTDFTIPARSVDMCTLRDVTPTAAASAFMEMVRDGVS